MGELKGAISPLFFVLYKLIADNPSIYS